jgi:hypothetical protein
VDESEPSSAPALAKPLFPVGATSWFRAVLLGVAGAVVATPAALIAWQRTPYATGALNPEMQPLKFDHRHHVRDDGIACVYCHTDVRRSSSAGMPAASTCLGCHAQIWTNSPELAPLHAAYFNGAPLAWQRVTSLPDHVFFDHSSHVNKGVGCVTCHGRVDLMAQVYAVQPFTMKFCLSCHRDPEPSLRPLAHVTDMEWSPRASARLVGHQVKEQLHVDPHTDCTTCHR